MATAASLAIASHAMIVASLAAKRTVKFHIMVSALFKCHIFMLLFKQK
jgi:hypothetical protein